MRLRNWTLVDPSTVAVIRAVSDTGTLTSPTIVVPEKKAKKDKPSTSKVKKSAGEKLVKDTKYDELDKKWTNRFNKLEALLMAKTFQPTFSSAVKLTPLTLHQRLFQRTLSPIFNQLLQGRAHCHGLLCIYASASPGRILTQSTLEKTPLQKSISRPASSNLTNTVQDLHLPNALVLTPLLGISRPASLNQTDTVGQPASFSLTGTNTLSTLVLTPLPPDINLSVNLSPTNQSHHLPPTPAHLHCRDRTVSPP